jgi:hypothetical protein
MASLFGLPLSDDLDLKAKEKNVFRMDLLV